MITSLLSLYIASVISTPVSHNLDISNLIEAKSVPVKNKQLISPIIEATSSIAIDLDTGTTLYEKNAHERLPIASITKLMTTLVILEENKLNEIVTVSSNAASTEGSYP